MAKDAKVDKSNVSTEHYKKLSLVEKCDKKSEKKLLYGHRTVLWSLMNVNLTFMIQNVKVKNINENGKKDI